MSTKRVRLPLLALAAGFLAVHFGAGVLHAAPAEPPFLLPVEYAFSNACPGDVLVVGTIESGTPRVGDEVELVGMREGTLKSTITGIEMFRKGAVPDAGGVPPGAGDGVGLTLHGVDKKDIRRGMVVVRPGTIKPHAEFRAMLHSAKDEGGRHTPFHNKMTLSFGFRTTDVTGEIELEGGRNVIAPGSSGVATVRLIVPVAMDKGLRFAIREGGRTVGAGQVIEIIK
ncbi:MAG: hypothetical protein IPG72_09120 [Ardenticatenales bacterium]|nr:hypothetical protein [Ardenticatenales bacterium]